ncbi:MAG: DUF4828 domain-containing protein [Liquorilactobacillus nagelii]|uniref:DUF4828 domain-containing protein n=1 Tax=Liquorilactobacillus nagelii TaxID=82688 RepID=UPI0039ED8E50
MIHSNSRNANFSLRQLIHHAHAGKRFFHISSAAVAPDFYTGHWYFSDKETKRAHQLEITEQLGILIDGHQLPGKIVQIYNQELLFLDKYGYHLRIDASNQQPVSLYDEADNRVYPVSKAADWDQGQN